MKRRVFKNKVLQHMYDVMLERGDPSHSGSGHAHAFRLGYTEALKPRHTYPRSTPAYAAWAAGVDRRTADETSAIGEYT